MRQAPETNGGKGVRDSFGVVVFIARALAAPCEVFLHRPGTLGERYFHGLHTGAAVLLIAFWPAFCRPEDNCKPLYVFLVLYAVLCLVHRARIAIRVKRGGPQPHTRYTGTPWTVNLKPRVEEARIKCLIEPALTFLIGAVISDALSRPLGSFLMVASLGLLISSHLASAADRQRALDMHDAAIDQASMMGRFRQKRGGR